MGIQVCLECWKTVVDGGQVCAKFKQLMQLITDGLAQMCLCCFQTPQHN